MMMQTGLYLVTVDFRVISTGERQFVAVAADSLTNAVDLASSLFELKRDQIYYVLVTVDGKTYRY